jgi:Uncharacterised nucleotidyltransferase
VNDPRVDLRPHDDRETLLLLDCARATVDPETAERIRTRVSAGLNWNRLLALAQRHGLVPLLYAHVSRSCGAMMPVDVLAFLRDYSQENSAFGLLLTGELVRLLRVLEANGITAVPYKGPAIALKLYGTVARRQFADLDILVRKRDVWEAGRLIEAEGFEPERAIPRSMRARLLRHGYVRTFRCSASRAHLELHWDIAERYWAVRFDADAMWRRLEPMPLPGATAFVPCAEDLLLLQCVHGVRHGLDKLEGIGSIAELLRRTPDLDWPRVWRQSREMHCRRMLEFALLLAHGLFDVPLPPQAEAARRSPALLTMASATVRNLVAEEPPSRTWRQQMSYELRLKDSRADQARCCTRALLMSTPDDWATLRLPEPLSFVYPLVRAVRVARKQVYN